MKALEANFSIGKEMWGRFRSRIIKAGYGANPISLELTQLDEPPLMADSWLRIRTIMSSISDLDQGLVLDGDASALGAFVSFPFVPGNENLGIVTESGRDVRDIEIGDRVVVNPLLSCEPREIAPLCPSCRAGNPTACRNFSHGIIGTGFAIGACRDTSGGWADSFVCHASQVRVVPNDVESETAILVPEFARAVRAILQHPPAKGDKVLVIGGGTLGLLTTYALRELVDHDECNLIVQHPFEGEMARHLGLGESILSIDPAETYEQVADVVDGAVRYPEFGRICLEGGADLVFETTGERDHCEDAFRLAGEGKRVILASARQTSGFDLSPLWLKNTAVAGSLFSGAETYNGTMTTSFDIALDLVARRDSPLRSLVTHTFRLDDFRQAMEAVADRSASRALKAIFHHVV